MSTRRVKNVAYDDYEDGDGDGDWGDGEWGEGDWGEGDWGEGDWGYWNNSAGKNTTAASSAQKTAAPKSTSAKKASPKKAAAGGATTSKAAASSAAPAKSSNSPEFAKAEPSTSSTLPNPPAASRSPSTPTSPKKSSTPPPAQKPFEDHSRADGLFDEERLFLGGDDVAELDAKLGGKRNVNIVVVGHVDAGKSTMMGHLLVKTGAVTAQSFSKLEKEAKTMGKESFKFAFLLDEGDEERARGVTVETCAKHFEIPPSSDGTGAAVTILDAPGHKEFVPTMIQTASLADAAILVVDVRDFDAGFTGGGQTKEHARLLRVCGVQHVIVVLNKMDLCPARDRGADEDSRTDEWDYQLFAQRKEQVVNYLSSIGFRASRIACVPLSGFQGENLVLSPEERMRSWPSDVSGGESGACGGSPARNGEKEISAGFSPPKRAGDGAAQAEEINAARDVENASENQACQSSSTKTSPTSSGGGPPLSDARNKTQVATRRRPPTLLAAIGATAVAVERDRVTAKKYGVRFCVTDACPSGGSNTIVSGKLSQGTLRVNDYVLVLPSNEAARIRSLVVRGNVSVQAVPAGLYVDGCVLQVDPLYVKAGSVLVESSFNFGVGMGGNKPAVVEGKSGGGDPDPEAALLEDYLKKESGRGGAVVSHSRSGRREDRETLASKRTLRVEIVAFDSSVILVKGQQFSCYLGTQFANCTLQKVLAVRGAEGNRKPKCLAPGVVAEAVLALDRKLLVEPGLPPFDRVVLRAAGTSVAAARVVRP